MDSYLFLVTFDGGHQTKIVVIAENRSEALLRLVKQVSVVRYSHDIHSITFLS